MRDHRSPHHLLFTIFLSLFLFSTAFADSVKESEYPKRIKYGAIHHSQVKASKNSKQFLGVNNFHRHNRGYNKSTLGYFVGYNWFCDVDGTLTQTRAVGEKTAAQLGHNWDTESICLAGDFNIDYPTKAQEKVLAKWINERPFLDVRFHRDLQEDRTCPGKNISYDYIAEIVKEYNSSDTTKQKEQKRVGVSQQIEINREVPIKTNHEIINLRVKRAFGLITSSEEKRLEALIEQRKNNLQNLLNKSYHSPSN